MSASNLYLEANRRRGPSRREVVAGGAAGAFAGLVGLPAAARAQTPEQKQVDIWAVRDPQEAAAIAIAKELNFYKDEGTRGDSQMDCKRDGYAKPRRQRPD